MTLYEFNMLDKDEQYNSIWELGTHLDSVIIGKDRIALYAIDRFFVEVYYDKDSNAITQNKAFKHGHNLDKYSGDISL